MRDIINRLAKLEQANKTPTEVGQRVERFMGVDSQGQDAELLQIYWNGKPMGKVMFAWMYDAWPERGETIEAWEARQHGKV